jgi:hypothetical protein
MLERKRQAESYIVVGIGIAVGNVRGGQSLVIEGTNGKFIA